MQHAKAYPAEQLLWLSPCVCQGGASCLSYSKGQLPLRLISQALHTVCLL